MESGVTAVATTPHCNVPGLFRNHSPESLRRRVSQLQELLREHQIPLKLYTGMEVYVTPEVPRLIRQGSEEVCCRILEKEPHFGCPII